MKNLQAEIDTKLCVGCELCTDICPSVFKMKKDKVTLIIEEIPMEYESAVQEAVESCPCEVIKLK